MNSYAILYSNVQQLLDILRGIAAERSGESDQQPPERSGESDQQPPERSDESDL